MIPHLEGKVECFLTGKRCKESCTNILPINCLPDVYANIDLIPQELLNFYVYDSVMQDTASNCHNLHALIAAYFDSICPECAYKGIAYRYTTKKKSRPRPKCFYNFSLTSDGYSGGSGLTQNQKLNHLWKVNIEGVNIEKFIDIYCTPVFEHIFKPHPLANNYVQSMHGMAEREKIIIGRPLEEPEYLKINLSQC